ncbi:MAG: Nif3-like dinuclear metal center hexameric protein [Pseudomonadota bacterium]
MERGKLVAYLDELLCVKNFRDYCPNGLQVEGRGTIERVVMGVSACQALLDAAMTHAADAILVHHGWFWRGEETRVTGTRKKRLHSLLKHDINLLAYHLPLDSHPQFGNNAQLAERFAWTAEGRFAEQELGWFGRTSGLSTLEQVSAMIGQSLQRAPLVIGEAKRPIQRVAWCSGGAQQYFEQAIACGVDAYLSGEISEQTVHLARESGVAYIAAGHHATERYGVQALAAHLTQQFGLNCIYVDIDNPV